MRNVTTHPGDPKMTALDAFIAHNTDIAETLKTLSALCDEHFNTAPDDVNWGHVGTLYEIRVRLDQIVYFAGARKSA